MKLSKREADICSAMRARPGQWTLEEVARLIFCAGDLSESLPAHWAATTSKAMVLLCAKTGAMSLEFQIDRVSRLGRGRRAIYELKEKK